MTRTRRDPARVYLGIGTLNDGLEWAVWLGLMVWWIDELALPPVQLVALGAVLQATTLLFETPTGVVADLYSRRWSVFIGLALIGIAYGWAVLSRSFWAILPAQMLYGFGWTFRSGAWLAWVTDELKGDAAMGSNTGPDPVEKLDGDLDQLILRRHRYGLVLGSLMVIMMMIAASRDVRAAMLGLAGCQIALAVAWLLSARERHFTPAAQRETFRGVLTTGVQAVGRRPRLTTVLIVASTASLATEALDRLGYVRFVDSLDADQNSVVSIGVLFIVASLAGVVVNLAVSRMLLNRGTDDDHPASPAAASTSATDDGESGGTRALVLGTAALLGLAALGAATAAVVATTVVIGFGLLVQDSMRESMYSVIEAWTNRETPSEVRATVHSLVGQAMALCEIVGGLALAFVAEAVGVPTSLVIAALLLAGAGAVSMRGRTAM